MDLELVIADHPVLEDLHMKLSHATDQRLTCLLVDLVGERRVFLGERGQGIGQFPLVGRAETGSIDMLMTVSGNSIFSSRTGCEASHKGVAGDRVFQPHDADDVAGHALLDLHAFIGPDVIKTRADFLLVATRVVDPATGLHHAGVDPDEREVAVGIVGDLEDEAAERLGDVRLADDLGPLFRVVADDRRAGPSGSAGRPRRHQEASGRRRI